MTDDDKNNVIPINKDIDPDAKYENVSAVMCCCGAEPAMVPSINYSEKRDAYYIEKLVCEKCGQTIPLKEGYLPIAPNNPRSRK